MKSIVAPLFVAAALVGSGCTAERTYENQYGEFQDGAFQPNSDVYSVTSGPLELQQAALRGNIGPVRNLDSEATQLNGWHDRSYTNLEVIVDNDRGEAAMAWLDINGGLFHPAMRPGTVLSFDSDSYPADPENELYIGGVACSTDSGSAGQWDYDQPIDEVTVEITDGADDDSRRLNFTTRTGSDVATGYVDYRVQD